MADYHDRYLVTVRDIETGKDQIPTASWSHPFFARMPENTPMAVGAEGLVYQEAIEWAAWVDAKDLQAGYQLLNPDESWAEVLEVQRVATPLTAYNLTVEEFSTFFVAANVNAEPVWVHNCSAKLGRNLVRSDLPNSDRLPGFDAHHIVGESHRLAEEARGTLNRYGIDLDSAANGIFLPRNAGVENLTGATVHPRTRAYYDWVNVQIGAAQSRQDALNRLSDIRGVLSRGETPWLKP